jgi:PiT family inorganic phosphate transporter
MFGFLSSGLFLGWSLGANDASNVFGTAVASRMIKFRTAAIYCSVFVILGAVISGAGASHTLGKLGAVNAVAGAFVVAFAAAMSVYLMTIARFPVSTSQAIVGAIIGWNLFSGSVTDMNSLTKIVSTWILCPLLAAGFAIPLYLATGFVIKHMEVHMFKLDAITRWSLLGAGIFGSYSLGANNIANVMGVFVPMASLADISVLGITLNAAQQLFLLGGIAIAVGVFTYSKRVMLTVGKGIFDLSPVMAAVVVWSHSFVLFIFSSVTLESWLISHGLPSFPLVPVSSSQAIVGAVIGIGLLKGGKSIRWKTVAGITSGWVTTPILAALISLISLFFLQNVFQQATYRQVEFTIDNGAMLMIEEKGISSEQLKPLLWQEYPTAVLFKKAVEEIGSVAGDDIDLLMKAAEIDILEVSAGAIEKISHTISAEQKTALEKLEGRVFTHRWQLDDGLAQLSSAFRQGNSKEKDEQINTVLQQLYREFRI